MRTLIGHKIIYEKVFQLLNATQAKIIKKGDKTSKPKVLKSSQPSAFKNAHIGLQGELYT